VLPVVIVDALSWVMVAWIIVTALCHWAAATALGMGWLGLLLPQVTVLVGGLTKMHAGSTFVLQPAPQKLTGLDSSMTAQVPSGRPPFLSHS
jgi:hypothetical protein